MLHHSLYSRTEENTEVLEMPRVLRPLALPQRSAFFGIGYSSLHMTWKMYTLYDRIVVPSIALPNSQTLHSTFPHCLALYKLQPMTLGTPKLNCNKI